MIEFCGTLGVPWRKSHRQLISFALQLVRIVLRIVPFSRNRYSQSNKYQLCEEIPFSIFKVLPSFFAADASIRLLIPAILTSSQMTILLFLRQQTCMYQD